MRTHARGDSASAGAVLLPTLVFVATVAVFSTALMTITQASHRAHEHALDERRAFYAAQAGVHEAVVGMLSGSELPDAGSSLAFGGGSFSIESIDLGDGRTSLVAVANVGSARAVVELVVSELPAGVPFGVFGRDGMSIKTGAQVDSYDSRLGSYASQTDHDHALVHSNGDIVLQTDAVVHGDARPGPGGVTSEDGGTATGDTSPSAEALELDPIGIPTGIPGSGVIDLDGETLELASGTYAFDSLTVTNDSVLTVRGPATLVLGSMAVKTRGVLVADTSGGPIEVYSTGQVKVETRGAVQTTSRRPRDLTVYVHAPDSQVKIQTDGDMHAVLYAPDTKVSFKTEGAFFGAIAASELLIETDSLLHFDRALVGGATGGGAALVPVGRRTLSESERDALRAGEHQYDDRGPAGG